MKSFKVYLEETAKEYNYRIKTVVPIDNQVLENVKDVLKKYNLLDISDVKKTPMQKHPMDFYDVENKEVFMIDVVTGLPASAYILQQELRKEMNLPEKYIVVRTDNSPLERENNRIVANQEMEDEAREKGWERESRLSVDSQYPENEQLPDGSEIYGDNYNQKFTTYLAQVAKERQPDQYEAPDPLFSWLDMPQDYPWPGPTDEFNDGFDQAPKPVPRWEVDANKNIDFEYYNAKTAEPGNFDDDLRDFKKAYRDPESGKRQVLQRDSHPVRNED